MNLKSLHIISFGGLRNCDIELSSGVNVIEGLNESGKSSAAMFIKFIFYGLSSKSTRNSPSERQRYINRTTGQAAGYIMAETSDGTLYRLERAIITSDDAPPRERIRIIDQSTGEVITGQNPGEYFFDVPADVFVNTCFLSQAANTKPELAGIGQSKAGAVENLLTSADENVDIKRAITTLDNTRRELLHKNKNGGEISELKEKRGALMAEMKSSSEKAAEILNVSTSLEDIKRRIAELEEAREKYDGIFSALDKIVLGRRIRAFEQTREKIDKLNKALSDLNNSPFGDGFEEVLIESERDIRTYDEECAAYDEKIADFSGTTEELPDPSDIIEEIHLIDSTSRTQFAVASALLAAGLIGLAASFLLYYFNTDIYVFPLITTLIIVTLGVIFMIRHSKTQKALLRLLDEWDAESADEIETAVQEKMSVLDRNRMMALEREQMNASLDAAKLRFDAAEQRIQELAASADLPLTDDIYETITELHRITDGISAERSQIQAKIVHFNGRLEALEEQLEGVDIPQTELEIYSVMEQPYGKIAAALDSDGIKNAVKERDFTENALRSAMKRKSALEEKLSEIGRLNRTPDEMATMLEALNERITELTLRHDACELAEEALRKAGESMRSGVIPRIAGEASAILSCAAPHDRILLDGSWNAGLASGNDFLQPEHLSRGTSDLAYIALRIALANEVFRSESPIIVFDESFAHVDGERIRNLFRQLTDRQYLIFTCRRDEADAARELGCTVVEL